MQLGIIRIIDRFAGIVLCLALTLVRYVLRAFAKDAPEFSGPVRNILFLKLSEQGATVLAYGAIKRAVDMVGANNVYFCCFAKNRPILDIMDLLPPENIIPVSDTDFVSFATDILAALRRMRRLGVDTVIDMELYARVSAILCYLSGAQRRVGLHRFTSEAPYRGDLFTHRIQYSPYLHIGTQYDLMVQAASSDTPDIPLVKETPPEGLPPAPPQYVPAPRETGKVRELLTERGVDFDNDILVVFNPRSGELLPIREWAEARFISLGGHLHETNPRIRIVLTGLPSDLELTTRIARDMDDKSVVNIAGELTLRELLALYGLADVLVTADSGPGHFASLTPIHTVAMFGPETPALYGPLGDRATVIYKNLACSPCLTAINHRNSPCRDNRCMQRIFVEEIHDAVLRSIEAHRRH